MAKKICENESASLTLYWITFGIDGGVNTSRLFEKYSDVSRKQGARKFKRAILSSCSMRKLHGIYGEKERSID